MFARIDPVKQSHVSTRLRLGTRGSFLARAQSGIVADELMRRRPDLQVELVIFKTSGDRISEGALRDVGGKGLFTKELEIAILAGEIDFAVHSYKDMPVTMPLVSQENLIIAAVPARLDPRDVLVSRFGALAQLPPHAKVGTGSLRRTCQLLSVRPDLVLLPLRGNVDTRLRKLREGQFDAIVLAMAGLVRGGMYRAEEMTPISVDDCLPAAGQGALAIQCRRDDSSARAALSVLHHPMTALCVDAERAIVDGLNGDCRSPIAALGTIEENTFTLTAAVGAHGGVPPVILGTAASSVSEPMLAVEHVLEQLRHEGADAMLAAPARASFH